MYVYTILSAAAVPPELPEGILGELAIVANAELAVVVEAGLTLDQIQQSDDHLLSAVLSHDRVIHTLFQQTTLLPLRFGICFASTDKVLEHLAQYQHRYLHSLARLEGKAEYLLKCIPEELPPVPLPTDLAGKAYFQAKKAQLKAQLDQQQQQMDSLADLSARLTANYPNLVHVKADHGVQKFYILAERSQQAQLIETMAHWQTTCRWWTLNLEGKLPPYHFVASEIR
jgi:hypothetical protein